MPQEKLDLLRKEDCAVTCVLSRNAAHFVTPLALQALSEDRVYTELFSLIRCSQRMRK